MKKVQNYMEYLFSVHLYIYSFLSKIILYQKKVIFFW